MDKTCPCRAQVQAAEDTVHPARWPSSQARTASRRLQFQPHIARAAHSPSPVWPQSGDLLPFGRDFTVYGTLFVRLLSPFALDHLLCSPFYSACHLSSECRTSPHEHIPSPLCFPLRGVHVFNLPTWPRPEKNLCESSLALSPLPVRAPFLFQFTICAHYESPSHAVGGTSAHGRRHHVSSQSSWHKRLAQSPLAFTHTLLCPILPNCAFYYPWNVALTLSFILTFFLNSREELLVFVSPSLPQAPARTPSSTRIAALTL